MSRMSWTNSEAFFLVGSIRPIDKYELGQNVKNKIQNKYTHQKVEYLMLNTSKKSNMEY